MSPIFAAVTVFHPLVMSNLLCSLKIGVEYLLTVTAANARGSSPPITINYTATAASADKVVSPHTHTNTLLSITSFLMVMAGVVALATCVSVGLVAAKRRRDRKRKKVVKTMYVDPLKEDLHTHEHTIVCVKGELRNEMEYKEIHTSADSLVLTRLCD